MNTQRSNAPTLRRSTLVLPALLAITACSAGCSTPSLDRARHDFYAGRFQAADQVLTKEEPTGNSRVLYLMERGTIRQAEGHYEKSSKDFIEAFDILDRMAAVSVTKDTGSMVINDTVQDFKGAPFERTLLHTFTAKNHLAQANWVNAAVEARRIIISLAPEQKSDYPDDAYSRYMAGFCLEMIDDDSNAALQYREADEISSVVHVDDRTGRLSSKTKSTDTNAPSAFVNDPIDTFPWAQELVCFVMTGRSPRGSDLQQGHRWAADTASFAEIRHEGQVLGRSYTLADTVDLAFTTEQKEAVRKMIKTAARVAAKETIAHQVEQNDELLGALVRLVLIGMLEQPDLRRWETLPRYLQVARVPCPPDLKEFDVVFKSSNGGETGRQHITNPITHRRRMYVSFCRDIMPKRTSP
ncbi:MAG: hypothetical protein V1929_00615 [bacterium]